MVAFTIATGVLGYPIAYWLCVFEGGLSIDRLTWCATGYAATMALAASLGALLELYYKGKAHPFVVDMHFLAKLFAIFVFEIAIFLAIIPVS